MAFAPFTTAYTPAPTRCSSGATAGARVLQDWACDESPWAAHLFDVGIFACRDVLGGWCPNCDRSRLSQHASGRAGDSACTIVVGGNPHAAAFAAWLVANHAILGVQEVIWNRRRWTLATGWRTYTGVSPHIDHVHWTLNSSGGRYLTLARILSVAPKPPALPSPPPPIPVPAQEDDVFFYDYAPDPTKPTVLHLVQVVGQHRFRINNSAAYAATCRAHPDYLGVAVPKQVAAYDKVYPKVVA